MAQEIVRVLGQTRAPQRARVQSRAQLAWPKPALTGCQLDGALNQVAVQALGDQGSAKADQSRLAEGRPLTVQAIADQLPAAIQPQRFNGLVIRGPRIGLEERYEASCAGGAGGWPFGMSPKIVAYSARKVSANSS